ncbi:hypothetical protein HYD54_03960 [Mycoplasmopsis bovis]|nr:hypothetical protein [Mycoplasmopsis bovis]QQH71943.1 hypothetical protein HYD54_03960 [Mycoplasmopsis bovis]
MFKNSSAPQLNFTLIGVALELTIKQQNSVTLSEFCYLVVDLSALISLIRFIKYFFKLLIFSRWIFCRIVLLDDPLAGLSVVLSVSDFSLLSLLCHESYQFCFCLISELVFIIVFFYIITLAVCLLDFVQLQVVFSSLKAKNYVLGH